MARSSSILRKLFLFAAAAACMGASFCAPAHAQVNPATDIRWAKLSGAGTPSSLGVACNSANYDQPFLDTATTPNSQYVCGITGWALPSTSINGTACPVGGSCSPAGATSSYTMVCASSETLSGTGNTTNALNLTCNVTSSTIPTGAPGACTDVQLNQTASYTFAWPSNMVNTFTPSALGITSAQFCWSVVYSEWVGGSAMPPGTGPALIANPTTAPTTTLPANVIYTIVTSGSGYASISGVPVSGYGVNNVNVGTVPAATTTGADNTAVGAAVMPLNTSGNNDTAVGLAALYVNTTGYDNTAIGSQAGAGISSGNNDTAVGYEASGGTTGNANTAVGETALTSTTTGSNNTGVGTAALASNVTGSNNTAVGSGASPASSNLANTTAVGYGAQVAASNTVQLGNASVTHVYLGPNAGCQSTGTDCPTTIASAANIAGGVAGSVPYQTAPGVTGYVAPNTSTTPCVLQETGTGSAGQAPACTNAPTIAGTNITAVPGAAVTGTVPAATTAAADTQTTNSTLVTLSALSLPGSQVTGTVPAATTAAGLSGTPALPNGTTCTTQAALDSSTKCSSTNYADTAVANSNPAQAVLAASTANLTGTYAQVGGGAGDTFTVTATGAFTLDGIAINTIGQRVLLKNQTTASQNGVYTATTVGATSISPVFTRAANYNVATNINNSGAVQVLSGTTNALTTWLLAASVSSIGSSGSSVTYSQLTAASGGAASNLAGAANSGFYNSALNTTSAIAKTNNCVIVTNSSGVPGCATTLPTGLTYPNPTFSSVLNGNILAQASYGAHTLSSADQAIYLTGGTLTLPSSIGTNGAYFIYNSTSSAITLALGSGASWLDPNSTFTSPSVIQPGTSMILGNIGSNWFVYTRGNTLVGKTFLVSGTKTVSYSGACTPSTDCVYKLTNCGPSGTAIGVPSIGTVTAGTSFVINSLSSTNTVVTGDTSAICYAIN